MSYRIFTTWLPDIGIECATLNACESVVVDMVRRSGVGVVYPTNIYPGLRVQDMDSGVIYDVRRNSDGFVYLGVME